MIPKIPKAEETSVRLSKSRYDFGATRDAIQRLNDAARVSRKKTDTEKQISRIRYSIGHDFRKGFHGRKHGDEALTIARKQIEWLGQKAEKERHDAKVEQLRVEVEILRDLLAHKERMLCEADNSRGSGVFIARRIEIETARRKAAGN